jgi:hypothetical protein
LTERSHHLPANNLKPSIALFLVLRASNALTAKPSPPGFSGLQGPLLRCDDYFGDLKRCSLDFPPIAIIKQGELRGNIVRSEGPKPSGEMTTFNQHPLEKILQNRIAIIDGAMGTTIRSYGMTEADIRGKRFKDSAKSLLNNGDLFTLTKPEMIGDIHRRFLDAGADIIETNTFGATSITQSEFFVEDPRERGGRKDPAFYQKVIDDPFLATLAWDIN